MNDILFAFIVVLGIFVGFPAFLYVCMLISDAKHQRRLTLQTHELTAGQYENVVNDRAEGGRRR